MRMLLAILCFCLLNGCAVFSAEKSIMKSDLKTVSVRTTEHGWQLIHKRIALRENMNHSGVRDRLEKSMQQSVDKVCESGVLTTDYVFEKLFLLDYAHEDRHHQYNLLARIECLNSDPAVISESVKIKGDTYQIIKKLALLQPADNEQSKILEEQIKTELSKSCAQKIPGKEIDYSKEQYIESSFDQVEWITHILKVTGKATCP